MPSNTLTTAPFATVQATDDTAPIAKLEISADQGKSWTTIAANANAAIATLSQQGDVEVWARATDQAGNVSDVAKAGGKVDSAAPTVTAAAAPASRMVRGGIGFDLAAKTAMVGEQPLPFTRSEYAISEYLALHAGQTFSKEQIYEAVFGYDGTADDTAVTQHIKNIRAKLRTAGVAAPETVLKTIWGVGYQWKSET